MTACTHPLFERQIFLITGGAQGIGLAAARAIAEHGGIPVLADMNDQALSQAIDALSQEGIEAKSHQMDVRDADRVVSVVQGIEATTGPIYGAVCCAGITRTQPAETMSAQAWHDVIDINLTGTFNTCQAVGRKMLERHKGVIVNIASITSFGGQSGRVNYAASKWAVSGLTKSLAVEWGSRGVRVNAVGPNAVDTPMLRRGVPEAFVDNVMCDRTPMGRIATAREIANVIVFLLSEQSSYVNGAVIPVDGGLTAGFLTHLQGADLASTALSGAK